MDKKEKEFLQQSVENAKKSRHFLTTVKLSNGITYALFDNGDIYQVEDNGALKKVNDIIDKDKSLKEKIMSRFDDSHNSNIKGELKVKDHVSNSKVAIDIEDIKLPEL